MNFLSSLCESFCRGDRSLPVVVVEGLFGDNSLSILQQTVRDLTGFNCELSTIILNDCMFARHTENQKL